MTSYLGAASFGWIVLISILSLSGLIALLIKRYTLIGAIFMTAGAVMFCGLVVLGKVYEVLWPKSQAGSLPAEYPEIQPSLSRKDYRDETATPPAVYGCSRAS
jgi:hypothetical protein